jgi:hypothetical protein
MAEKQTGMGRHLFLAVLCTVLAPTLVGGCGQLNGAARARSAFAEANDLFGQGSYQASLERYGRIGAEHPLTRDRVLFETGIIHAYPKNAQRDYQKALDCFQELVKDYPESAYRQNSETMIFTISNVALKDRTIAAQQAKIEAPSRRSKAGKTRFSPFRSRSSRSNGSILPLCSRRGRPTGS